MSIIINIIIRQTDVEYNLKMNFKLTCYFTVNTLLTTDSDQSWVLTSRFTHWRSFGDQSLEWWKNIHFKLNIITTQNNTRNLGDGLGQFYTCWGLTMTRRTQQLTLTVGLDKCVEARKQKVDEFMIDQRLINHWSIEQQLHHSQVTYVSPLRVEQLYSRYITRAIHHQQ